MKRLVIMSAFGVGESLPKGSLVGRFFYKRVLAGTFTDKARGETRLKSSDLDWTLVYPVTLTDKPGKQQVHCLAPRGHAKAEGHAKNLAG